jgi:hypothetical protein
MTKTFLKTIERENTTFLQLILEFVGLCRVLGIFLCGESKNNTKVLSIQKPHEEKEERRKAGTSSGRGRPSALGGARAFIAVVSRTDP